MKWLSWLTPGFRRKPAASLSLTQCPKCGREMDLVDKTTFSGSDMRTYRCEHCREEQVVDYGAAVWKVLSDAREADK